MHPCYPYVMVFQTLRFFLKDPYLSFAFGAAIVINSAAWIFLVFVMPSLSAQAFLHYTVYFGIDWTGAWYQILYLPLSGIAVGIVNNTLATIAYKNHRILAYFFASTTVAVQCLLLADALLLWRLNG